MSKWRNLTREEQLQIAFLANDRIWYGETYMPASVPQPNIPDEVAIIVREQLALKRTSIPQMIGYESDILRVWGRKSDRWPMLKHIADFYELPEPYGIKDRVVCIPEGVYPHKYVFDSLVRVGALPKHLEDVYLDPRLQRWMEFEEKQEKVVLLVKKVLSTLGTCAVVVGGKVVEWSKELIGVEEPEELDVGWVSLEDDEFS
ncbi:hypothetical protein BJ508DRAFT_367423 [Ascobolus immersus RN42]|uniref:Uncharacterized protein n=1 Tax=Ascobolus immersus RN42 TaxID=1160509 RepID=A0A3N4HG86_ASCIM|nr:hypothetical protein BJ508DRAFT_367423 [Ascobolus immersus RN42]